MIHKAQEILNAIKNQVIDEQADGYRQPRTVQDYNHKGVETFQELINCQLTVVQAMTLHTVVSDMVKNARACGDTASVKELEDMQNGLLKQMEMWENTSKH